MKSKFPTILLIFSLLINLTIGVIWIYNRKSDNYSNCLSEKKQLTQQIDTLTKQLHNSWKEQKYSLEVLLNSKLDFQKSMPEYTDVSKEKFNEAIRQKVVELKMKLGDK
jgi:hypothetical protein